MTQDERLHNDCITVLAAVISTGADIRRPDLIVDNVIDTVLTLYERIQERKNQTIEERNK